MADEELESRSEMRLARPREIARFFGRAVLYRCPNCGGHPVLRNGLKLRERCPQCGLRLERGEHDYFSGSVLFNFIFSELLFAVIFAAYLVAKGGNVDWDVLQWVLIAFVALAPIVMYSMSKLLWLAFDLMLRPVTPEELEWHRTARSEFSTGSSPSRKR